MEDRWDSLALLEVEDGAGQGTVCRASSKVERDGLKEVVDGMRVALVLDKHQLEANHDAVLNGLGAEVGGAGRVEQGANDRAVVHKDVGVQRELP